MARKRRYVKSILRKIYLIIEKIPPKMRKYAETAGDCCINMQDAAYLLCFPMMMPAADRDEKSRQSSVAVS